jgi:hypothetical protein
MTFFLRWKVWCFQAAEVPQIYVAMLWCSSATVGIYVAMLWCGSATVGELSQSKGHNNYFDFQWLALGVRVNILIPWSMDEILMPRSFLTHFKALRSSLQLHSLWQ